MKISCPACNANYRLPDDRVQGKNKVFKIACKRCGADIKVRGVETPDEVGRTTLPFALDLPENAAVAQAPAQIWFAGMQGRQVGPMSEAEMLDHIGAKRLGPDDLVWRKGFSAWTPAREVPPFDEHLTAEAEPAADADKPAARKGSPRRAQTLELSAAMIELLVKLDGQQPAEAESATPASEPPELPPLDADVSTLQTPAARPGPAGVAGDPKALADLEQVQTLVSTVPAQERPKSGQTAPAPAAAAQPAGRPASKPDNKQVDVAAADSPPPTPARTSGPQPEAKNAAAAAAGAKDSSIRIRLPDEPSAKDKARAADNKVALPGQTSKRDVGGSARTSEPKPANKAEEKAQPAAKPAAIGPTSATSGAMRSATAGTTPGLRVPPKSGGGTMISVVIGVVLAVAIIGVVISMWGKSDTPAKATEPAPDANVTTVATLDAGAPEPAPAPAPAAVAAVPTPAPAPTADAQAGAAADASPAAVDPAAVVAKAAEDKAAADKAAADKAEVEKAAAAKAEAEKAVQAEKDKADAAAKDKAEKGDKAAADKQAAEKREEERKAAKAEKEAADAAKKAADKQHKEEAAQKAAADKAEKDRKRAEERAKADQNKQAAEEKRKAAEEQKKAAAEKKAEELAKKKAADQAKKDAEEAAKQAKVTKKPTMSDDDVEELLRKHDKKAPAEEEGMTQAQVAEIGKKATKSVANCYLLHAEEPNEDTIKVQAMVNSSGSVERATVMGKHGANKAMAGCISEAVKKLLFPTSSGSSKKYTLAYRVGG